MWVKKQQLEPDTEQLTGSKLGNFYAEYIMKDAGLDEFQAGVKTSRRNINNIKYADNNTLLTEIKEKLKSLLMRMK